METFSLPTIVASTVADVNQVICSLYRKLVEAAKTNNSLLEPYKWLCKKLKSRTMWFYCRMVIEVQIQGSNLYLCPFNQREKLYFVRPVIEITLPQLLTLDNCPCVWFNFTDYQLSRWVNPHLMGDMRTKARQNCMPVWRGNKRWWCVFSYNQYQSPQR